MTSSYRQPRMRFAAAMANIITSEVSPSVPSNRSTTMNIASANTQNTGAWLTFTYVSFAASVAMMGIGVWALPADLWVKGYLTMAAVFMLGSSFTLSKTVRDEHEAKRFANRIEDAKAERLLMEVGRAA
jgi:hypothetical protein